MNRKVISLLAILALLVSMLTCIVIPAGAATNSTQNVAAALYYAINWSRDEETQAIETAFLEAYKTNADYDTALSLIDKGLLEGKQADGETDLTNGALGWIDFDPTNEDKVYPRYIYHAEFVARGYPLDKWSITKSADWEEMRTVADAANVPLGTENAEEVAATKSDYFEGTEFHLTNDVVFSNKTSILPMGYSIYEVGGGFAGTINGHGYGFSYIFVQHGSKNELYKKDADGNYIKESGQYVQYDNAGLYTGLFHSLADCEFIDFGLNSGSIIYQTSGNGASCVSSFGNVKNGANPKFTRVWSSAAIAPKCNARATALVGSFDGAAVNVDVNGFVFDGAIVKGASVDHSNQISYAIYSGGDNFKADGNDFHNIIADFRYCNGAIGSLTGTSYTITSDTDAAYSRGGKAALFNFGSVAAFEASDIKNVYAIKRESEGIHEGYTLGINSIWGGSGSEDLLTDMTAEEVAWTINNNPTSLNEDGTGAEPVYFTLNSEGKVRPVSKENYANRVVKLTLTGDRNEEIYVNRGVVYDFTTINKTENQTFSTVDGFKTSDTQFKLTKNVTVEVTDTCEHIFTYTPAGEEHTATCSTCGYTKTEACTSNDTYTSNTLADDAMTHTTTCAACNNSFTQSCSFTHNEAENKYVCVCGRTADAPAAMVAGDANGSSTIDLADAIQVLRKVAGKKTAENFNERNADVDGDNVSGINDVRKIILHYLGDQKTKEEVEAIAARVNKGNHYVVSEDEKENTVSEGNLKMDGTEGTNERYTRTDYISVSKGNKIVFGPVREAQAVLGYFYDADWKPLKVDQSLETGLINYTDIEIEYTFNEGLVMASVVVPEGAAYVRLQANAKEKDQFYIRINNEFSLVDYQCRTQASADNLENPLSDQLFLTVGDSLCAAASEKRDSQPDGVLRGWARRIYQQYDAKVINSSEGGSGLSTVKYHNNETGEALSTRQCIVNQLNEHTNIGREFEYILLEGGGNDAANTDGTYGTVGTFHSTSKNPADFDDATTYAGGLERLIYTAIREHGDTAAIGYMSYYAMPYAANEGIRETGKYFEVGKAICEKWGIKYLDLYTILEYDEENPDKAIFNPKSTTNYGSSHPITDHYDANAHTHDGIHANDAGYDIMQNYIGPFTQTMRPVDVDVYTEVQKYDPIGILDGNS